MALDERTREQLLAHCGEIHDDDGVDPREFFKTKTSRRKVDRKDRQLCRQVTETLSFVISGDGHDELLQSLHVVSVQPAPDSSRLLVTVGSDLSSEDFDPQEILGRLNEHAGRLRCDVAAAITRKRAPTFVFDVVRPPEAREMDR